MQIVELSLDHPFLFCPVTGQTIVDGEDSFESPALAFSFIPEIGEFSFIKPEFQDIYEKCELIEDVDKEIYAFDLFLEEMKTFDKLVMFSITTHGFSCGPVSETIYYCFNMNHVPE